MAIIDLVTGDYTAGAMGGGTDIVTVADSPGSTAMASIHVGAALSTTVPKVTSPPRRMVATTATGGAPMLTTRSAPAAPDAASTP